MASQNKKGKGRAKDIPREEKDPDEDSENDDEVGADWDKPFGGQTSGIRSETILRWSEFEWRPHRSMFLRGAQNWITYKEALLAQLESIGYYSGIRLMPLDEAKLYAAIQRTADAEPLALVRGYKKGTRIMRLFQATYRQIGENQQDISWNILTNMKYDSGCPIC